MQEEGNWHGAEGLGHLRDGGVLVSQMLTCMGGWREGTAEIHLVSTGHFLKKTDSRGIKVRQGLKRIKDEE